LSKDIRIFLFLLGVIAMNPACCVSW